MREVNIMINFNDKKNRKVVTIVIIAVVILVKGEKVLQKMMIG